MKMRSLMFCAAVIIILTASCDLLGPDVTLEDVKGEWDFPDGDHLSVMISTDGEETVMLDLQYGENFYYADGSFENGEFVGTYHDSPDNFENPLRVSFELTSSNTLSITCTDDEDGPLNGVSMSGGEKLE